MFSIFWVSYVLWPPCGKLDVPKQLSEDFQSLARKQTAPVVERDGRASHRPTIHNNDTCCCLARNLKQAKFRVFDNNGMVWLFF